MLIINTKNITPKRLYYCYSPPLRTWLKNIKCIYPIQCGVYKKPGKHFNNTFEVFILNDILKDYLQEWTNNKINKTFAMVSDKDG